jgi:signal transduction histidine kinase
MKLFKYYFSNTAFDRKLYYLSMFFIISFLILFPSVQSYNQIQSIINKNAEINRIFENWLVVKNETVKYIINKPVEDLYDTNSYERTYRLIESVSHYEISMENIIDEKVFRQMGKKNLSIYDEISKMIFIWQDIQFKLIISIFYNDDIDLFVNEIFEFITETDDFEICMKSTLNIFNQYLYSKVQLHWILFSLSMCVAFYFILLFSNITYNYSKLVEKEKKIRELSHSLIKVRDNERIRIAADLHDVIVQNLMLIKRHCENSPSDTSVNKIKTLSEKSISSVRDISFNLKPPEMLDNISDSIRSYCNNISATTDIKTEFIVVGLDSYILNQEIEIAIYRLFVESINNAVKHSEANIITVRLILSYPYIVLKIEDNGTGFDLYKNELSKEHMGLKGMEDRVNLIDGTMKIRSVQKIGTFITFKIPCKGLINEKNQHNDY